MSAILFVVSASGPGRTFLRIALTGLLLLTAVSSDAQPAVRQVLLLQSFARGNLSLDAFTANFQADLDARAGSPVNVVQIVVGPTGFIGAPEQAVVDFVRATFGDRPRPDLMVTAGGPAAALARKYRSQLFPETPLLLASVDQQYLRQTPLGTDETAVAVVNDYPELVDDILQLLPETRQVFMVMGSGPLGTFWRRELEEQFTRFRGRLTFVWSNELTLREILERCTNLPAGSVILYLTLMTDGQGGTYADARALADLHATANAPIFAKHTVAIGHGVVGGRLMSIAELSRTTADAAVRILNGAPPDTVRVPLLRGSEPLFDWRELQRWDIPESRLPPGSVVRYRPRSMWQDHRAAVLSAAGALAVQSLLIAGLLQQRRARRRAEFESRRHLALATDASRRQTMSTLTSSIAHELGQPLSSIIHNAQALQMMVAANRATPETMEEILSDIRTEGTQATQIIDRHRAMLRSGQLDRKPIDLHSVIDESLALIDHDMKARRIEATLDLSSKPCIVTGDQVLLQQVLVNLVMNAMDAMADTLPQRRRVTIRTESRAADVALSVRDAGTGLPADVDGTLFTPFVTTKTQGLGIGLAITRSIVDAHGGTIAAHNNPDGGATFTVTLRRSDTPGIPSGPPSAA